MYNQSCEGVCKPSGAFKSSIRDEAYLEVTMSGHRPFVSEPVLKGEPQTQQCCCCCSTS